jgi:ParB-like chromosome segregation protein Spo0J
MEIVYRPINTIKPLGNNPRKITQEQLVNLKQSIEDNKDYFECRPVILSDRTGELVAIDGNQRMRAAKELGWKEGTTNQFLIYEIHERGT